MLAHLFSSQQDLVIPGFLPHVLLYKWCVYTCTCLFLNRNSTMHSVGLRRGCRWRICCVGWCCWPMAPWTRRQNVGHSIGMVMQRSRIIYAYSGCIELLFCYKAVELLLLFLYSCEISIWQFLECVCSYLGFNWTLKKNYVWFFLSADFLGEAQIHIPTCTCACAIIMLEYIPKLLLSVYYSLYS